MLYSVFKLLDIKVEVRPVLSNVRAFEADYEEEEFEEENGEQEPRSSVFGVPCSRRDLPREGTPAELEFLPDTLPGPADYMDVDKRWKTLYFSLEMRGKGAVSRLSWNHRLRLKSKGFFKNKGEFVGDNLLSYKTSKYQEEEGEGLAKVSAAKISWIDK